jgi:hypothetical protein
MARRRHRSSWEPPSSPAREINRCRVLIVIDNQPLQAAAWADLRRARKLLEKATRELHRHEETDEPAFKAWISTAFPTLVSTIREIAQQVEAKSQIIDAVERESFFSGRPAGQIWREWQKSGGRPPESLFEPEDIEDFPSESDLPADEEAVFEEEMKRLFAREGIDEDDPVASAFREAAGDVFGFGGPRPKSGRTAEKDARTIYRRLVQQLHPDRGGTWTPARARAWEQTQAAWAARDADWLARLEAEWEAGTDMLGPTSAIGRLRAAVSAITAAHRDTEKRLRIYRKHDAWRFSLRPPSAKLKQQLERQLRYDETMLRRDLAAMEETLTRWEKVRKRRPQRRRPPSYPFGF